MCFNTVMRSHWLLILAVTVDFGYFMSFLTNVFVPESVPGQEQVINKRRMLWREAEEFLPAQPHVSG